MYCTEYYRIAQLDPFPELPQRQVHGPMVNVPNGSGIPRAARRQVHMPALSGSFRRPKSAALHALVLSTVPE
jgi:hypothetical protein